METVAPIEAAAGNEPGTLAVAPGDHAKPIMLDLVKPIRADRRGRSARREANFQGQGGVLIGDGGSCGGRC